MANQSKAFQLGFNGLLKVDFQGSRITSNGGLVLVRELDERLGLGELIDEHLTDSRQGLNKQFTLADLLRQSGYSHLASDEDLNDAERLSMEPTFRVIGSQKIWEPHDGSVKPRTMTAGHNFTARERSSFASTPLVLTGHFGPQSRRPLRRPARSCQPKATPSESRSPGNCSQDLGA